MPNNLKHKNCPQRTITDSPDMCSVIYPINNGVGAFPEWYTHWGSYPAEGGHA